MRGNDLFRKFVAMKCFSFAGGLSRVLKTSVLSILVASATLCQVHSISRAQSFSASMACSRIDTIDIGQVLQGDSTEYPLVLTNKFSPRIFHWAVTGGSTTLRLLESSGNGAPDSTWKATIVVQADTTLGPHAITVDIRSDTDSCTYRLLLVDRVIGPTPNDTTFSLQTLSENVIAIQTDSSSSIRSFNFANNASGADTINSITIFGSSAFSITSKPMLPLMLQHGQSFKVGITYRRSSLGSDNADLLIGMPDNPILLEAGLQGVRTATDGVQGKEIRTIYFFLYPNPSFGNLTIHTRNISQARVVITDLLGRVIEQADFAGDWIWDDALDGTYFVNLNGTTTGGTHIQETKRIVVMH